MLNKGTRISAFIIRSMLFLLNLLTLYAYSKLRILQKPPGRLIFIQLIIFLIIQLDALICISLSKVHYNNSDCGPAEYISRATVIACSLYEVCTALEIFIRINDSPMGQNYGLREKFYHITCLFGTLMLMGIVLYDYPNCNPEPNHKFYSYSNLLPIIFFSLMFLVLGILIMILINTRNLRTKLKRKRLKYNIIYLCISFLLLGMISSNWVAVSLEDWDNTKEDLDYLSDHIASVSLLLAKYICELALFYTRLHEPGVRKFLKDKYRSCKRRFFSRRRPSNAYRNLISTHYISSCALVDELKQEVI